MALIYFAKLTLWRLHNGNKHILITYRSQGRSDAVSTAVCSAGYHVNGRRCVCKRQWDVQCVVHYSVVSHQYVNRAWACNTGHNHTRYYGNAGSHHVDSGCCRRSRHLGYLWSRIPRSHDCHGPRPSVLIQESLYRPLRADQSLVYRTNGPASIRGSALSVVRWAS